MSQSSIVARFPLYLVKLVLKNRPIHKPYKQQSEAQKRFNLPQVEWYYWQVCFVLSYGVLKTSIRWCSWKTIMEHQNVPTK